MFHIKLLVKLKTLIELVSMVVTSFSIEIMQRLQNYCLFTIQRKRGYSSEGHLPGCYVEFFDFYSNKLQRIA